jgi:hypothetical protein
MIAGYSNIECANGDVGGEIAEYFDVEGKRQLNSFCPYIIAGIVQDPWDDSLYGSERTKRQFQEKTIRFAISR